jgi:hypothetical protein
MARQAAELSTPTSWLGSRLSSGGGSVSLARRIIVDQFVFSEKASGAWALTDDYWGFWAENEPQALTSLKQRRLAAVVNAPTFTADRGYAGDALTSYIDTGFIPATHAVAMTANNAGIDLYSRTDNNSNTYAIGATSSTNRILRMRPRSSGTCIGGAIGANGTFTLPAADSRGLLSISRNGPAGTDTNAYKNGVLLTRTIDPSGVGASLPIISLTICAENAAGVVGAFAPNQIGFASARAALSAGQEAARYNAVQAWATSIGANV